MIINHLKAMEQLSEKKMKEERDIVRLELGIIQKKISHSKTIDLPTTEKNPYERAKHCTELRTILCVHDEAERTASSESLPLGKDPLGTVCTIHPLEQNIAEPKVSGSFRSSRVYRDNRNLLSITFGGDDGNHTLWRGTKCDCRYIKL